MRESSTPAYVEIDSATGEITSLRVPVSAGVDNITPAGNDMEVELSMSRATHLLRAARPGFEEMLEILERARAGKTLVALTATDNHEIIDVRPPVKRA